MEFVDTGLWKPIHSLPGFECCIEYYVNKYGQVKSTKGAVERILKPKINKKGYLSVNLTQRIGRKSVVSVYVHKLVALAFLGPHLHLMEEAKVALELHIKTVTVLTAQSII